MKPKVARTEKEFGRDIKEFEKLPEQTKEGLHLQHRAEKATGATSVAINKKLREKTR